MPECLTFALNATLKSVNKNEMRPVLMSHYKVFVSNSVGCESTESEGNRVINYLKLNSHTTVNDPEEAEYIIVNTCAFVESQRKKVKEKLQNFSSNAPNAKLIVMGCAREIAPDILKPFDIHLFCGHHDLDQLDSVFANGVKFEETPLFSVGSIGKVVIVTCRGCVGTCTYCSIKRSTGSVRSQPPEEIIKDIQSAMAQGYSDFFITGDDLGAYGLDIGTDLPSLLAEISKANLKIKILLGNINPRFVNKYIDDLVSFFQSDLAHKWIFFPIQSANNEVLRSMGRLYTVESCVYCINKLLRIKNMKFYYDIIVGFPTETESAFKDTLQFILEYPPSSGTVTMYSREVGTLAYNLKPLPEHVLKKRHRRFAIVFRAAQQLLRRKDPTLVRPFGT